MIDLAHVDRELFNKMFGVYVRETRLESGLQISQLQKATNISRRQIKMIEEGAVSPRTKTLEVLCATLNLNPEKIDRIVQVARIAFIDELTKLAWSHPGTEDDDEFPAF